MSRFVVIGAGAVGATIAAELHRAGVETLLIARGTQLAALRGAGLTYVRPDGEHHLHLELRNPLVLLLHQEKSVRSHCPMVLSAENETGFEIKEWLICLELKRPRTTIRARRDWFDIFLPVLLGAKHESPGTWRVCDT